jgi:hypothetical protein
MPRPPSIPNLGGCPKESPTWQALARLVACLGAVYIESRHRSVQARFEPFFGLREPASRFTFARFSRLRLMLAAGWWHPCAHNGRPLMWLGFCMCACTVGLQLSLHWRTVPRLCRELCGVWGPAGLSCTFEAVSSPTVSPLLPRSLGDSCSPPRRPVECISPMLRLAHRRQCLKRPERGVRPSMCGF